MPDLKVSAACYNEIANALDAQGKKIEAGAKITLEKDDKIINPIDWRLVTLRRDVADIAAKFGSNYSADALEFIEQLYEYVLTGAKTEVQTSTPAKW